MEVEEASVSSFSMGSVGSSSSDDEGRGSPRDDRRKPASSEELKRLQSMIKTETRTIRLWRLVILVTLLAAGAAVSTYTYLYLSDGEEQDFVTAYTLFANTIDDITSFRVKNAFEALSELSEEITAYENNSNETFPFVTPPIFEVEASHTREQSGVETIRLTPFITREQFDAWNEYAEENRGWYEQSKRIVNLNISGASRLDTSIFRPGRVPPFLTELTTDGHVTEAVSGRARYGPTWMMSPPPLRPDALNLDSLTVVDQKWSPAEIVRESLFSEFESANRWVGTAFLQTTHDSFHDKFVSRLSDGSINYGPHAQIDTPVFAELQDEESEVVAMLRSTFAFDFYMSDLLPNTVSGIFAVLTNTCGETATYELTGNKATFLGYDDFHDNKYDHRAVPINFSALKNMTAAALVEGHCLYQIVVYPTDNFANDYKTTTPIIFTSVIAATFAFMIIVFFVYDRLVDIRNDKTVETAARSSTIVSSLFPSNVRDRLYAQAHEGTGTTGMVGTHTRLKSYLKEGDTAQDEYVVDGVTVYKTKPIAELFPETTIMFGDISGFTAWSSSREPAQVFTLLETLYHSFDEIANRRGVFKVETVGDCYVAVSGLPDPCKEHAVVMSRFARDCMHRLRVLTKRLEVSLGPDTADLSMRIGLHSGPVTAGVLRGERSRFQLFGDTMNTASRMESNGIRDKIQVSQETADLLVAAGKEEWLVPRREKIVAKGKGELTTYWLNVGDTKKGSSVNSGSMESTEGEDEEEEVAGRTGLAGLSNGLSAGKIARLVDWNFDVLSRLLKQIIAKGKLLNETPENEGNASGWARDATGGKTVLDEVQETIALPPFHSKMGQLQHEADQIELDVDVSSQLHEFIANLAAMYHDNPFHNFEHASHVTMSVVKLLSRIVAPVDILEKQSDSGKDRNKSMASKLHDHTYGITSDPLTQFACVFSALIHDVDHSGVPNSQLIKENSRVAAFYKNKSVAEQNSVDLAWDLLQDERFSALRCAIHETKEKRFRFRQLVVNSVMATDIMDKDLKALRNNRWERAFSEHAASRDERETVNRKATIVIEHLIQASDVAHTMQHWHVYRKWNERLFFEMYKAYAEGRAEVDPSQNWYKGEIGFFDFYIIPLAKKLKDCGVFGVSSDEYLNYAMKNRAEWEIRGHEVLQEMVEKVQRIAGSPQLD